MKLQLIDYLVITFYLVIVSWIGVVLRKGSRVSKDDYLLGGKRLPWWMLGISNASGMFDVSGTLWMVSIMFVYGLKSVWLPWLWPVFNQVFMFVYLASWIRKSEVTTGAEWMLFRFGGGAEAMQSHRIIVVFALLASLGFMTYGFVGLGKFVEIFIPFSVVEPYLPFTIPAQYTAHFYGIVFTLVAMFYAVVGGMQGVVWADILQYSFMATGAVAIAVIAVSQLSTQNLTIPEGWDQLFFSWNLDIQWSGLIDDAQRKIDEDQFEPFAVFFSLMAGKGILASLAGPTPNYDMQKVLSTRNPREASLMSMWVNIVLLPIRYLLIIGFTVLGLLYFDRLPLGTAKGTVDFETLLPAVMCEVLPAGVLGLLLVELMAAFMGTFAGTLNTAQAYWVNDVYLKSINPGATPRQTYHMQVAAGVGIVLISILLGLFSSDVNSVLQWIVGALYGGFIAANVLKWYWWRFNANGYFWGMVIGIGTALVFPLIFKGVVPLYYFPLILLLSLAGSIVGSILSRPVDMEILENFYRKVNPWGFWGPVRTRVCQQDPDFVPNPAFKRDMSNVIVGIIAQTAITVLPVFFVLLKWKQTLIVGIVLVFCCIVLYHRWYLYQKKGKDD